MDGRVYKMKKKDGITLGTGPVHSPYLTVTEVAEALAVDGTTVRRWIKMGVMEASLLPQSKNGSRLVYRIHEDVISKILGA
jgi:excisionase family DNA binding protein